MCALSLDDGSWKKERKKKLPVVLVLCVHFRARDTCSTTGKLAQSRATCSGVIQHFINLLYIYIYVYVVWRKKKELVLFCPRVVLETPSRRNKAGPRRAESRTNYLRVIGQLAQEDQFFFFFFFFFGIISRSFPAPGSWPVFPRNHDRPIWSFPSIHHWLFSAPFLRLAPFCPGRRNKTLSDAGPSRSRHRNDVVCWPLIATKFSSCQSLAAPGRKGAIYFHCIQQFSLFISSY